jgi:hypothetical protein
MMENVQIGGEEYKHDRSEGEVQPSVVGKWQ